MSILQTLTDRARDATMIRAMGRAPRWWEPSEVRRIRAERLMMTGRDIGERDMSTPCGRLAAWFPLDESTAARIIASAGSEERAVQAMLSVAENDCGLVDAVEYVDMWIGTIIGRTWLSAWACTATLTPEYRLPAARRIVGIFRSAT